MPRLFRVARNVEFGRLFDSFFISAITTILLVRFYLYITGYPQIGNSVLHISHLLPGGALMLVALLFLLGTVNRAVRDFSAIVGGIGFGLVLDEIGKFITKNNDYFFKDAPGLIYLTFVSLYLIARFSARRSFTQEDYLANVLDLVKDGAVKDLDQREYAHARQLLAHVSNSHYLYKPTVQLLDSVKPTRNRQPSLLDKLIYHSKRPLIAFSRQRYFPKTVVGISLAYGLISLGVAIFFYMGAARANSVHFDIQFLKGDDTDFVGGTSALVSAGFVIAGLSRYLHNFKLKAYRFFELALLINIFIEQAVLFFKDEGVAIVSLAVVLILLVNINLLSDEEQRQKLQPISKNPYNKS